jgi:hypothetical protein
MERTAVKRVGVTLAHASPRAALSGRVDSGSARGSTLINHPDSRIPIRKPRFLVPALLPLLAFAQAGVDVEIVDIDPPTDVTLSAREPIYVRLSYRSDRPLRFQAGGYLSGAEVTHSASFNPAPVYPAGRGEAIVWISYDQATAIDEVRIGVAGEDWTALDERSLPVNTIWNGMPSQTRRQPAAWVRTLSAEQQAMVAARAWSDGPAGDGDSGLWGLLLMVMGWSIPGYLGLQVYMLMRYEGRWRRLALLPLWVMVPLLGYTLFALLAGSNLWPLVMLFLAPFAFVYLMVVLSIRTMSGRSA